MLWNCDGLPPPSSNQLQVSCVMRKQVSRSLSFSYQQKAWLVPAQPSLFWYNTDYRIVLCCLDSLYLYHFMAFLWLMSWFVKTFEQMMRFYQCSADLISHNLLKSYDKSAHQPQKCHEMTHFKDFQFPAKPAFDTTTKNILRTHFCTTQLKRIAAICTTLLAFSSYYFQHIH